MLQQQELDEKYCINKSIVINTCHSFVAAENAKAHQHQQ